MSCENYEEDGEIRSEEDLPEPISTNVEFEENNNMISLGVSGSDRITDVSSEDGYSQPEEEQPNDSETEDESSEVVIASFQVQYSMTL